jgi:poly-gamma-glutamate synthesis protein (capsule biosynthesis protein)
MEGTFTHESAREYKEFAFKAPPEYASILSGSSVELANLANNHSSDYGQQSYHDTIDALEGAGIRSFGYERTQVLEVNGVKVGFVGSYALAGEWYAAEILSEGIEQVKQQGAQVIIVTVHWGEEKHYYPSSSQVSLAHLAIDEGADLVVGHHPHVFQGQETYQGKQIIYSLGNFCFGGNRNPYDMDAIIYQQTFTLDAGQIKTYDDYQIIPCSTSSREDYNDYRPRILEGSEGERVLAKYHELRVD